MLFHLISWSEQHNNTREKKRERCTKNCHRRGGRNRTLSIRTRAFLSHPEVTHKVPTRSVPAWAGLPGSVEESVPTSRRKTHRVSAVENIPGQGKMNTQGNPANYRLNWYWRENKHATISVDRDTIASTTPPLTLFSLSWYLRRLSGKDLN